MTHTANDPFGILPVVEQLLETAEHLARISADSHDTSSADYAYFTGKRLCATGVSLLEHSGTDAPAQRHRIDAILEALNSFRRAAE